ncbi:leucine-rich repeat-containing protein 24-like [Arapaima gigas]
MRLSVFTQNRPGEEEVRRSWPPALSDPRVVAMALAQLSLLLLSLPALPGLACPSGCRCYSLTVECGSIGLRDIPAGVPSTTQVSLLSLGPLRAGLSEAHSTRVVS